MIITCGQCQTKFRISSALIRETGSRVRCSNCQAVFTVFKPLPGELVEEDPRETPLPAGAKKGASKAELSETGRKYIQETASKQGFANLDNELEDLLSSQNSNDPNLDDPFSDTNSVPQLAARPPKPAENNPINLIKKNGDTFVVSQQDFTPRQSTSAPPSRQGPDLGLGEDPVSPGIAQIQTLNPSISATDDDGALQQPPTPPLRTKSKITFSKRQKILLLVLSIFAAFLAISTFFLSLGPGPANRTPVQPADADAAVAASPQQPDAPSTTSASPENDVLNLIFIREQNSHHYIMNQEAGPLLVIAGRIQNGYEMRISHIRVKASLKNSSGSVLSERQVFAGNYLTEEELKTLPIKEILAKLTPRGGQNGQNQNIPPGQAVPFMIVFDKLPADLAEYNVEPVSYAPAVESLSTLKP
ncbi:MAG: zinc-ribbon domain-containing protein [Deltaproteobacteria bacterium]|jgi:predicted Zn finger-like uncharacterized protein|nr:zinc-ribbon domain-containing protein [Deltaproteobacteria bacterium]